MSFGFATPRPLGGDCRNRARKSDAFRYGAGAARAPATVAGSLFRFGLPVCRRGRPIQWEVARELRRREEVVSQVPAVREVPPELQLVLLLELRRQGSPLQRRGLGPVQEEPP